MDITRTDPEFAKLFENFEGSEVVGEVGQTLPEKTRSLAILAVLIGCGGRTLTAKCCLRQLTAA